MKTMSEILEFIHEFEKTTLSSIELEMGDIKIKLNKDGAQASHQAVSETVNLQSGQNDLPADGDHVIESPLVGTYYESPSPEAEPFISVGVTVHKGDTLCIIEAMKTMNEIKAPINGTVTRIHVKNQELVGYGQALVSIRNDA